MLAAPSSEPSLRVVVIRREPYRSSHRGHQNRAGSQSVLVAWPDTTHRRAGRGGTPAVSPGLFDLPLVVAPDGGLAIPERPIQSLTGLQLAQLVVKAGGADATSGSWSPMVIRPHRRWPRMARLLERDVLVPPPGSELRITRDGSLVPVDRVTGLGSTGWWCRRPVTRRPVRRGSSSRVGSCASGRASPRSRCRGRAEPGHPGRLRPAPDPGRPAAARPPQRHHGRGGRRGRRLRGGAYDGRTDRYDGRQLAAVLGALPLYGWQVRLWLAWPDAPDERRRLADNLAGLAAATGATVWAPSPGGRVILDEDPPTSAWFATMTARPLGALRHHVRPGHIESDVDGRLVPAGGVLTTSYPGVPLVSGAAGDERERQVLYERLRPSPEVFRVDLPVLADGRLGFGTATARCSRPAGGRPANCWRSPAGVVRISW